MPEPVTNSVELDKGKERYILRWTVGSEQQAIDALVDWVHNPELRFDWFDAGIMAKQIGLKMGKQNDSQP